MHWALFGAETQRRGRRAWRLARVFLPALAALVVAGCARAEAEPEPVTFRRTGGLAGVTLELAIDADGRAVLTEDGRTSEFDVAPERLEALYEALERVDFGALTPPPGGGPGRDLFEYRITYRGQTVTARDTQVPAGLEPVLAALNDILAAGREEG